MPVVTSVENPDPRARGPGLGSIVNPAHASKKDEDSLPELRTPRPGNLVRPHRHLQTTKQRPVALRKLNLDGDRQADLTVHGGEHRAYSQPMPRRAVLANAVNPEPKRGGRLLPRPPSASTTRLRQSELAIQLLPRCFIPNEFPRSAPQPILKNIADGQRKARQPLGIGT